MPFDDRGSFDRLKRKLNGLLSDLKEDVEFIGGIVAEEIIRTTLAGIGKGDQPFAPYSGYYSEVIAKLGGKTRQTVDLRGIIDQGVTRQTDSKGRRGKKPRRDPQKTIVSGWAGTFELQRRPDRGLTDPTSEMSLDLIKVTGTQSGSCSIVYTPRAQPYMIKHQTGALDVDAPPWWPKPKMSLPARPWFSADKAAVKAAATNAARTVIAARIQWFNDHGGGGRPASIKVTVRDWSNGTAGLYSCSCVWPRTRRSLTGGRPARLLQRLLLLTRASRAVSRAQRAPAGCW